MPVAVWRGTPRSTGVRHTPDIDDSHPALILGTSQGRWPWCRSKHFNNREVTTVARPFGSLENRRLIRDILTDRNGLVLDERLELPTLVVQECDPLTIRRHRGVLSGPHSPATRVRQIPSNDCRRP